MNISKMKRIQAFLLIEVLLLVGMFMSLSAASNAARAAPRELFVKPDGSGNACTQAAPCALHFAVNVATDGDAIYLGEGTYTGTGDAVITLTQGISVFGGWDGTTATPVGRDPAAHPSTLHGEGTRRVVYIHGFITPTLDGLTITGGNASVVTEFTGNGGGIFSTLASPVIQYNRIISNTAGVSPTVGTVGGGGIYLDHAKAAVISANQVLSNSALGYISSNGGGIFLRNSRVTVRGNRIQGNRCEYYGGGIRANVSTLDLLDNEIRGNVAGRNGGGAYLQEVGFSLIQDNLFSGNAANGFWHSGGLMVTLASSPTISSNRFLSNSANDGAGLGIATPHYFTVTNNVIANNIGGGIRLWGEIRRGLIAHNTIVSNTGEGGIRLHDSHITPTIVNNILAFNTYGLSAHAEASGALDYNDVWGNVVRDYDLPGALTPGAHDIRADPRFVDRSADDYHLRPGSPCIDAGMDAGVTTDADGDPRALNAGYDIGADEMQQYSVFVPLTVKSVAD